MGQPGRYDRARTPGNERHFLAKPIGNPANPAGFPLSHSDSDGPIPAAKQTPEPNPERYIMTGLLADDATLYRMQEGQSQKEEPISAQVLDQAMQ